MMQRQRYSSGTMLEIYDICSIHAMNMCCSWAHGRESERLLAQSQGAGR